MTFVVKYNRSRFPERQRREDGAWGCRGCGEPIPKGRQAWCSEPCVKRWHPFYVIHAVKARDKGICQECGFDTRTIEKDSRGWTIQPRRPEYDHIKPFSEGGLTVVENMRTLCHPCHRAVTKSWHGERAAARKPQRPIEFSEQAKERA